MKKITFLAISAITIFLSSCITTFQPLATEDQMITDIRISGAWSSREGEMTIAPILTSSVYKQLQLSVDAGDSARMSKTYLLSYRKNGIDYNMMASFIRIGGDLFMDLRPYFLLDPERPENNGFDFSIDYLPAYTIAKVEWKNDGQLIVKFADGAFVKKQLQTGHLRLKHENDSLFGTCIINASSKELQQFVRKYAGDERLFSSHNSITLNRKG